MGKAYYDDPANGSGGLSLNQMEKVEYSFEYLEFLNSDRWRELAALRRRIDGGRCVMCGRSGDEVALQVHHLSYAASRRGGFGSEDIWTELVTLCEPCHHKVHRMMDRVTAPDGRRGWRSEQFVPICNETNKGSDRWDLY